MERYTSKSTRELMIEAAGLLDNKATAGEEDLARYTGTMTDLSETDRQQLEEISRLLRADPGQTCHLEMLRRDASFKLEPREDGMVLALSITPAVAGGKDVTLCDVVFALKERNIRFGVDVKLLRKAIAEAADGKDLRDVWIVRGRPATPGQNETFEFFGRRSNGLALEPAEPGDLTLNAKNPRTCQAGDRIARRVPAVPGRPGFDALGKVLPPPPVEPARLDIGPNVRVEGDECLATLGGVVVVQEGRIEVRPILILTEDLTRQRGPVDFDGEVHVRSAVRAGARIKATGNITVDGPVESAHIESTCGDVLLRHGMAGQHCGSVRAKNDIRMRFAENVNVRAGRDIHVETGALHAHLVAGRAIHVVGGRGQIIGGIAMAGELVEARQVGTVSGVATEVCLGFSGDVLEALAVIDDQITSLRGRHNECAELADKIKRIVGDPLKLQPQELKTYTELRQIQLVCKLKTRSLDERRQNVLAESAKAHHGRLEVTGQLMPRVTIRIGRTALENKDVLPSCRVVFDEKSGKVELRRLR